MRFKNNEMLECLVNGTDLYSKEAQIYIWLYNDEESVCVYNISSDEADELSAKANESGDGGYWSAHLGAGGSIYDSPEHECYKNGQETNTDICEHLSETYTDWVDTREWN